MLQIKKAGSQPGLADVHVNAALTNISVAYVQDPNAFIADKAFPVVPVEQQANFYYLFTKEDFLRDEAKPRAPGAESAGGGFNLTTASYSTNPEAFHKDIPDQIRANADSVLSLDSAATQFVTQKLLIRRERRWVSNFFGTGIWGTDVTGVAAAPAGGQFLQWDVALSKPLTDLETGKMAILAASGMIPNTLVLGAQVFSKLRDNQSIKDQFKYTSADSIDVNMMARFFGVDRVLVANSVYTSTVEGNATPVTGFIAGKHALLCYVPPAPSLMTPAAGYTFQWNGYVGSIGGWRIKRIRMDWLNADRIEGEIAYDMKVVASALGYFLSGAVA